MSPGVTSISSVSPSVPVIASMMIRFGPPYSQGFVPVGNCTASRDGEAQFGHVAGHQLKLLVGDGQPGRLLDIARRHAQDGRGYGQLQLGLDPAPVALAIASHRAAVDLGEQTHPVQAHRNADLFQFCLV